MRLIVPMFVLVLGACGSESEPRPQEQPAAAPASAAAPAAVPSASAQPMMAIPDDPQALQRLKDMGYTIHAEEGHLHAPGVDGCPAMGGGVAM